MLANSLVTRTAKAASLAVAALSFLLFFTLAPVNAHAAALTLVTATTTSNNASSTLAKVGNTISYQIVLSGTPAATTTPVINIFNMGTTSMSGSGTNWTYSTTTSSSWTSGFVPFTFAWGGSVGEATTTANQSSLTSANIRFDKTLPVITSITSTASTTPGALKVGSTIGFTLTSGSPEYAGSVTGSYNSVPLTWVTTNGGSTFTATYTVTEGQTDQPTALQISGVSLSDAAGNTVTASGSDIIETIDANSPGAPTASLSSGTYSGTQTLAFTSTGSNTIYYSLSGAAPTCSTGNAYTGALTMSITSSFQVIGCDSAGNSSGISSFSYSILGGGSSGGSSGGGGGGGYRSSAPVTTVYPTGTTSSTNTQSSTQTTTSSSSTYVYSRSLTAGSTGADVMALQAFLNAHGFPVALTGTGSKGHETTTFGGLTRAALAKFQASKGISPSVGYFGPLTRAYVQSHS